MAFARPFKRRGSLALASMSLCIALVAAACGGNGNNSPSSNGVASSGGSSGAPVTIRMQLSWVPQAQFAGYIVAAAKGFYQQQGLNVQILSGGPNVDDIQQLVSGSADVTVDRVSTLYAARDKGIPVRAIAEFDSSSGFWMVAKKSSGINTLKDFKGKTVGIYSDDAFEFDALMQQAGLNPQTDVKVFDEGFSMQPFIDGKYPVAMAVAWNDVPALYEAGLTPGELVFFKPSDYGVGVLHGVLISTQSFIDKNSAALAKFVKATLEGWRWAYQNPTEAIDIIMKQASQTTRAHQTSMLDAMKGLQWPNGQEPANWGQIPVAEYQKEATTLYTYKWIKVPADVAAGIDTSIWQKATQ